MQALVWDGQHLRLETTYPTPQADETTAVVRVRLAGMCATDLQILQGYMGFQGVLGGCPRNNPFDLSVQSCHGRDGRR